MVFDDEVFGNRIRFIFDLEVAVLENLQDGGSVDVRRVLDSEFLQLPGLLLLLHVACHLAVQFRGHSKSVLPVFTLLHQDSGWPRDNFQDFAETLELIERGFQLRGLQVQPFSAEVFVELPSGLGKEIRPSVVELRWSLIEHGDHLALNAPSLANQSLKRELGHEEEDVRVHFLSELSLVTREESVEIKLPVLECFVRVRDNAVLLLRILGTREDSRTTA
mmetsp:Transcript_19774/g.40019  ORF Transcript_19774/g.40019 Transcript_19774/m.40019 type:complete len:220 (-) Transcript_19774:338-997(-)